MFDLLHIHTLQKFKGQSLLSPSLTFEYLQSTVNMKQAWNCAIITKISQVILLRRFAEVALNPIMQ